MAGRLRAPGIAGFALAAGALASLLLAGSDGADAAPGQCSADTDCKGDRVCERGRCVDPPSAGGPARAAPAPAPAPAPARSGPAGPDRPNLGVCGDDSDCPADRSCQRGSCEPRPAAAPASAARPAGPAPARASGCIDDTECPGELVCERGACVAQAAAVPATGPAAVAAAAAAADRALGKVAAVVIEPDQRLLDVAAQAQGKLRFRPPNLLSSSARHGSAK